MVPTLTILDDFLPEAVHLRDLVLDRGDFQTIHHDGFEYPGIWRCTLTSIARAIHQIPGLEEARVVEQFFRRNTLGESATNWVHADIGLGNRAVVWYLNPDPPAENGTAFFRHKELGWDRLPEQLAKDHDPHEIAQRLQADSNDPSAWEVTLLVPGVFNRLIVYPTAAFHARWPRDSFGTEPSTARLIYVAFLEV